MRPCWTSESYLILLMMFHENTPEKFIPGGCQDTEVGPEGVLFSLSMASAAVIARHIFPKAQVTANKNAHNFRHHFAAQFFVHFRMV